MKNNESGFTIVELLISIVVFVIVSASTITLLISYISISGYAQSKSAAISIATQKIENLQQLSYNELAVEGGAIVISGTPLPASETVERSSKKYIVKTEINYSDDAFDGCYSYSPEQMTTRCVNGPPATGKPIDNNPRDYKLAQVRVYDTNNRMLATLSSRFVAKVAEVPSDASMIDVMVTDSGGNKVEGAVVRLQNNAMSPSIDQSITTDAFGSALFMDAPASAAPNYVVSVTKPGYSSLTTIAESGDLIPIYGNTTAILQSVSRVSLVIDPVSPSRSVRVTAVDSNGQPLVGKTITLKGGQKMFTDQADRQFYSSKTVTTDSSGVVVVGGLQPGSYYVDSADGYVVAAHSAVSGDKFYPFYIPPGDSPLSGMSVMQDIKVYISSNSAQAAIHRITPNSISLASGGLDDIAILIEGRNLSGATADLVCGANTYTGILTPYSVDINTTISRTFDLPTANVGACQLRVTSSGQSTIQDSLAPDNKGAFYVGP